MWTSGATGEAVEVVLMDGETGETGEVEEIVKDGLSIWRSACHDPPSFVPQRHTVLDGECIASIGEQYGFLPETLWDHPDNAGLRELRGDGNVLLRGDEVIIPERHNKVARVASGQIHTFRRRGVPETLQLKFTRHGQPRARIGYTFEVDGARTDGETDARGQVTVWIPPRAKNAKLELADGETYILDLGSLDPVDVEAGVRARLFNRGLLADLDASAQELAAAVRRFQGQSELAPTGELDDATRAALVEAHGI